ncbi:MAG: hypothetical protein R2710_30785 [Acidimicrobiales bacterium]
MDPSAGAAHLALDAAGAPNLHRILDAIDTTELLASRAIFAADDGPVVTFSIEEPLRHDVARSGEVLSLGTLVEYSQFSSPHAVVTIEDDMFGVTSFGSVDVPGGGAHDAVGPVAVSQSVHTAIEQLGFVEPTLLALVGTGDQLERYAANFSDAFPHAWVQHYATDDLDDQLVDISDQIVRDAQSRAAETLTLELAQFRAARDAGRVVEGPPVLDAVRRGGVATLLVHDDADDDRMVDGDRLVDHITHSAARNNVPLRMIPNLGDGRGPAEGLGAVLAEDQAATAAASPAAV